jgi:uncharacterized protein
MFAQPFIDSLDFARRGEELRGEIPLAEMKRLNDVLLSREGSVRYVLRGLHSQAQHSKVQQSLLELSLEGQCQLRCQRCLNAMPYSLQLVSCLRLVSEGDEAESDLENDESDTIEASKNLDVLDLIEEEILLSLPFAPKHEIGSCLPDAAVLDRSVKHPFAALAGLKIKSGAV